MNDLVAIVTSYINLDQIDNAKPELSKKEYLEKFTWLSKVKNPTIVFARSEDFELLKSIRQDLALVSVDTILEDHTHLINKIKNIQEDVIFKNFVNDSSSLKGCSAECLTLNFMKSFLVSYAIDQNLADSGTWAWVDLDSDQKDSYSSSSIEWRFNPEGKINLFCTNPFTFTKPIFEIVRNGDRFISEKQIIAPRNQWNILKSLVIQSMTSLFNVGLVDANSTILLMSYRSAPDIFNIHKAVLGDGNFFII